MLNLFLRLIEPMRSQKWRDAQEQKAFEEVFNDIPSDAERKRMSEKELAEVLSTCKAGTPAYILVEHELNRRIARIQSNATLVASAVGIVGVVVGILLSAWLQHLTKDIETTQRSEAKSNANGNSDRATEHTVHDNASPRPSSGVEVVDQSQRTSKNKKTTHDKRNP